MSLTISPEAPYSERSANTLAGLVQRLRIGGLAWSLSLFGVFLLALGLRLHCLDCYGFWGDEVASLEGAQLGLNAIFSDRFGWLRVQTPLHYLLVWLTVQPIDPTQTAFLVRLPSALFGALTPLAVYGIGRELFGRRQGMLAALLLSLSAIHLNHSQDLRQYALLTLLTATSVYCLLVAERTGSSRWWLAFAAAMIANVLNAYLALTMVMPAMAVYLLGALWRLWRSWRGTSGPTNIRARRSLSWALVSLLLIGLTSLVMFVDMLQVPRVPPDLGRFLSGGVSSIIAPVIELATWFAQNGAGGQTERLLQLGALLLALLGAYGAVRARQMGGVLLCLLFILVPSILLALLSTTNTVFQRYALFALPFYLLLVANGTTWIADSLPGEARRASETKTSSLLLRRGAMGLSIAMLVAVVGVFGVGAYNYSSPDHRGSLSYRPGFRDASRFLLERARPQDAIVFVDYPALGYTISQFYWRGSPPDAPVYDARDPRLFSLKPTSDIYWVVSAEDRGVLQRLMNSPGWIEAGDFEGVLVLRGQSHGESMLDSMTRLVDRLDAIGFPSQPSSTLRGSLYQASGNASQAAAAYLSAGAYFTMGSEYLQTARGYEARGDSVRAWREALLSKFWQPDRPEVHLWLAEKLRQEGYIEQSRIEAEIARSLTLLP